MKKMTTIIALVCVAVCVLGWITFATDEITAIGQQKDLIEQADAWMEAGLYQRAIKNYQEARVSADSLELCEKIQKAYALRYDEAKDDTYDLYVEAMEEIVTIYPGEEIFALSLANLYIEDEEDTSAYTCLKKAVSNGAESDEINKLLEKTRYSYFMSLSYYNGVKAFSGNAYVVSREGRWGVLDTENGLTLMCDYEFVSQVNEEGVLLFTDNKDSRLIDAEGMVLGIFKEKITEAGIFSEGLIAASSGAKFSYYDEFAQVKFGGYESAGAFVGGRAAVCKDGKWFLIDQNGKAVSEKFARIVLNEKGEYLVGDKMLAAKTEGKYAIYDKDLKEIATLDCQDVDILTPDGLIAICKNNKWGFVNTAGEVVIQPTYENARSFYNGFAAVCKEGTWGFINTANKLVIPYEFTDVTYFDNAGTCMVRVDKPEKEVVEDDDTTHQDATVETVPAEGDLSGETEFNEEVIYKEEWQILNLYNGITEE